MKLLGIPNEKPAFKALYRKSNGELWSYTTSIFDNYAPARNVLLLYQPGRITIPKIEGTRIYVCDTVAAAQTWFAGKNDYLEIWECETFGEPVLLPTLSVTQFELFMFNRFPGARSWSARLKEIDSQPAVHHPTYEAVRITQRVVL